MAAKKKQTPATPSPEKEHEDKHHQRKRRRQFIWLAVWLKLAWVAIIGLFFYFDHQINEVLAAHNMKVPGMEAMESEMALARTRIAQLEQKMRELEAQPAKKDEVVEQRLEEQRSKITTLEKQVQMIQLARHGSETQNHLSGIVLALVATQKKLEDGLPFPAEVQKINSLVALAYGNTLPQPTKTALAQLAGFSEHGAPTEKNLQAGFKGVAQNITQRQQTQNEKGWRTWLRRVLAKFITVRSLSPSGDKPEAILARAETAVNEGNLRLAAIQLQTLPEDLRRVANPWIMQALSRTQAEEALLKLESHFTNALISEMQSAQGGEAKIAPETGVSASGVNGG